MPRQSVDVAGELRRLQAAYAAALPGRADELEGALQRWIGTGEREAGETVHRLAHGLSGAGATYGLFELSALGRELAQQAELSLREPLVSTAAAQMLLGLGGQLTLAMRGVQMGSNSAAPEPVGLETGGDRRSVLLLRGSDAATAALSPMLSAVGYRVFVETVSPTSSDLSALVAGKDVELVLIEHEVLAPPERLLSLRALRNSHLLGVFGTDGSFGQRLLAARAGARVVLVPPYDDAGLAELEAFAGLQSAPPGRVLIVDDDVLVARSYSALLEDDGLITELEVNPLAVLEKVDAFRPNLILLDLNMPGVSGIEITRVLRQRPDLVSTSIVFLSGETSWDLQQQAMSAGADDFLLKPIEAERLSAAVRTRMWRLSQLDRRISRDSLTELMNQGTFKERVQVEVARALRESKPLALALFDLDHFKAVNDTHGHAAGDRVLRALAQLLRDSLRQTDVIARCGGEEFGVLLPGAGEREAQAVMDQVRRAFHDLTHSSAFGEFRVTLSCGIASLPAATNAATLVDWADRALYRAKGNGRNQVALLPESERRASTLHGIEAARARRGGAASSARGTPSSPVERRPK